MKLFKILLPFLLVLPMFGQDSLGTRPKGLWNHFTYDMGNVFGGMGHAYTRPLDWKGEDWANLGYLAAGTLILFAVDGEINTWTQGFQGEVPGIIMDYGHQYGNPNNNYMLTGGIYLAGLFTKNEKLRRTGVLLISSATAGGLLQQVSKRIIGRARPKAGVGHATFDPVHLDRVFDYDSFPSGHAMLAFSNAHIIAKQFKSPWIKGGLYALGTVPGLVRVMDDFHWFSDVAFSMALSVFIVESIDRYLDSKYDRKYNDRPKDVAWNLSFAPNHLGISINF